jgi:hypothetical protein
VTTRPSREKAPASDPARVPPTGGRLEGGRLFVLLSTDAGQAEFLGRVGREGYRRGNGSVARDRRRRALRITVM